MNDQALTVETGILEGVPTARVLAGPDPVATFSGSTEAEARRKADAWMAVVNGTFMSRTEPKTMDPQTLLKRTAEAFAPLMRPDMKIGKLSKNNYQKLHREGWRTGVHYEFLVRVTEGVIGAELHVEDERFPAALRQAEGLLDAVRAALPSAEVIYRPGWQRVGGRLAALYPLSDAEPAALAKAMERLVAATLPAMDEAMGI